MTDERLPVSFRLVRDEDLTQCGLIYAAAFAAPPYREAWRPEDAAEMLAGLHERDPQSCWLAEVEGRIAGFAFCTRYGKLRATIQEFGVSPEFQRRHLGAAMMQYVLDVFRKDGLRVVDLVVNKKAPASHLYRKFGFEQPDRYVLMAKWL